MIIKKIFDKLYAFSKAYLTKYKRIYYSQGGEDVVLNNWIHKDIKNGYYVDVGCHHPRKFSNTYFLYKRGWRGVNIDLEQTKIDVMNLVRSEDINIVAAISNKIEDVEICTDIKYSLGSSIHPGSCPPHYKKWKTTTKTLNQVLSSTKYSNHEIDLLTIDAEGHDFNVLLSLNIYQHKPKMILIESSLRNINKIIKSDLYKFLINKNYVLVNWVGYTLFFLWLDAKAINYLLDMNHPDFRDLIPTNQI